MQLLDIVPSRNLAGLPTFKSEFDPEKIGYLKTIYKMPKSWSVKYRSVKCELGHKTSNLLDDVTLAIARH